MCGDPAGRRAAIKLGGCWRPSRTPARFWLAQALSFHGSLWPKSIVSPSPSRRLGTRLYPAAEFAKAGAATPLAPRVGHGACACGFHVLGCESASKVHGVPAPGSNRADHLAGLRAVPATLYRDNARLGRNRGRRAWCWHRSGGWRRRGHHSRRCHHTPAPSPQLSPPCRPSFLLSWMGYRPLRRTVGREP
jgi:hypothetical protein